MHNGQNWDDSATADKGPKINDAIKFIQNPITIKEQATAEILRHVYVCCLGTL